MKKIAGVLCFLLCNLLGAATAQDLESREARESWEWTDEDRLERRYNPAALLERTEEMAKELESQDVDEHVRMSMSNPALVRIHGSSHPELFLPWELFQRFIATAFTVDPETQEVWRLIYRDQSKSVKLDESLWGAVEQASGDYIAMVRSEREFSRTLNSSREEDRPTLISRHLAHRNEQELCGEMIKALQRTMGSVGEETLLKVLYEGVAPSTFISHPLARGPKALLYVQGGCR